jgi:hypothetical protein
MDGSMERAMWQPGQPVVTEQDHEEWQAWRRARILEGQRWRRSRLRRIDYYPSKEAAAVIDRLRPPRRRGCQLDPEPDCRRMGRCFRNKVAENRR